jgi:hypothetical protein
MHLQAGRALYSDSYDFEGVFVNGRPEGDGRLTIWEQGEAPPPSPIAGAPAPAPSPAAGTGRWTAQYHGQWHEGMRSGSGCHLSSDGIRYEGEWETNKRHGHGSKQVPASMQASCGYASYIGSWQQDKRHGRGILCFPKSELEDGCLVYEGDFVNDNREGFGILHRQGHSIPLYVGFWKGDVVCTTEHRAWVHLVGPGETQGRFYHGQLSHDGQCEGDGTLYEALADDDIDFLQAMASGMSYDETEAEETMMRRLSAASEAAVVARTQMKKRVYHFGSAMPAIHYTHDVGVATTLAAPATAPCFALYVHSTKGFQDLDTIQIGNEFVTIKGLGPEVGVLRLDNRLKQSHPTGCVVRKRGEAPKPKPGAKAKHEHPRLKHVIYRGQWRANLPHGEGLFYFKGVGRYSGQFVNGRRHGRGMWCTYDASWVYRAVTDPRLSNWELDKMHGVATVEDSGMVHENVIYSHGKCQMPFTDIGPPQTNFDDDGLIAIGLRVVAKAEQQVAVELHLKAKRLQKSPPAEAPPAIVSRPLAAADGSRSLLEPGDDLASRVARQAAELAGLFGVADALPREVTEEFQLEEEVLISGGTGDNVILNGVYFRLSGTFGQPIFRNVRHGFVQPSAEPVADAAGGRADAPPAVDATGVTPGQSQAFERYLFKDRSKTLWVIAETPLVDVHAAVGCAFAKDLAEHAGQVTSQWYVWHPLTQRLRIPDEQDDWTYTFSLGEGPDGKALTEVRTCPPDRLVAESVAGFEVEGVGTARDAGLFTRHADAMELYGRPVYSAQGNRYLYWLPIGGTVAGGTREGAVMEAPGEQGLVNTCASADTFFAQDGHWIMAGAIGVSHSAPGCLAYVKGNVATPDRLSQQAYWHCSLPQAAAVQGVAGGTPSFRVNKDMRMRPVLVPVANVSL